MKYRPEQLIPLVARLSEEYTSKQSTSVSYERAQQLMEAVIFCLDHAGGGLEAGLMTDKELSVEWLYKAGVLALEEKTKQALEDWNRLMEGFSDYGNRCLFDTAVKGIPEFFKWYDIKFDPQNYILTLDYPILRDLSGLYGVDRIFEYIRCLEFEQRILGRFPFGAVESLLSEGKGNRKSRIENLWEEVMTRIGSEMVLSKRTDSMGLEAKLVRGLKLLLRKEDPEDMRDYLGIGVKNAAFRVSIRHSNSGKTPENPL